ncbi:MAG: filamentous hemagglutinin N-terminal domain-containing protein [Nostoc sp. DedSLP03]|uniref:two-partner secretion domain-containing protein n=1 Tax=Nostoc sp. DedSLP03 TaxID=3075400 RepID=UPI002AD3F646|nr:filamentous hemagglutinin N-terminal domain-containing protein [Nostoc sp. DedSLP03]MDZ7966489.1 filamentous hemagglutinin N-terminal domain-containing protein [Nostoc sp. DedSLP03]
MKQHTHTFWLTGGIFLLCLAEFSPTQAQNVPVPDTTLPTNSVVNSSKDNISITGGTEAGRNLFHSFQQFNIGKEQRVDFVSPNAAIENILIRVTGGSRSEIMGTLSTSGYSNPNLFLINPKGIVFGPNATLDMRGSFVATTANAIDFKNQGFFSASTPNNPKLLTVNPSAFLFNQIANQPINSIQVNRASLLVDNGQNLLLVGGNVTLDNAQLIAPDGRIELGGVAGSGTVGLNLEANTLRLNYPAQVQRADVLLTNNSYVSVTNKGRGSIAINAQNLDVLEESSLEAGIESNFESDGTPAGDITLDATEEIKISGKSYIYNDVEDEAVGNSGSILIKAGSLSLTDAATLSNRVYGEGETKGIFVQANKSVSIANSFIGTNLPKEGTGVGNSGDINIQTGSLYLTNDSKLTTSTFTEGRAGDVTINAQNTVSVDNSLVKSNTSGLGDGGKIDITTGELTLTNGSQISSLTEGEGNAGDINIYPVNAFSSVNISGVNTDPKGRYSSGLVTSTEKQGAGQGGNINVTTGKLGVSDGGVLSARTRNASPGGNITVEVNTLEATNGGQVITSTFGTGRAGDIKVTATNSVKIFGSDPTYSNRFYQQSNPTIVDKVDNDGSASGLLARVRGQETANAGNIRVQARSINLDNQGVISATTTLGEGGNIELHPQDFLLMRRGSQISTTAGTQEAGGNGGNITINAPNGFILAVPSENSDITANAFTGSGGRVDIQANGIYGIEFRKSPTVLSDITASSEFGTQGTVELNTLDTDPNSGLELPTIPVDTKVAQDCYSPDYAQNRFAIAGRGGLPPNPKDILTPDAPQIDWVSVKPTNKNRSIPPVSSTTTSTPKRIVEATGATLNAKGQIVLSANSSAAPYTFRHNPIQCHGS